MADKEERILITKVSPHCHALRFSCDPVDIEESMFCDKSGRYVRITPKDCAKCKNPVLAGISRAEAVERMAKAIYFKACGTMKYYAKCKKEYIPFAEAALDAILGGKNG